MCTILSKIECLLATRPPGYRKQKNAPVPDQLGQVRVISHLRCHLSFAPSGTPSSRTSWYASRYNGQPPSFLTRVFSNAWARSALPGPFLSLRLAALAPAAARCGSSCETVLLPVTGFDDWTCPHYSTPLPPCQEFFSIRPQQHLQKMACSKNFFDFGEVLQKTAGSLPCPHLISVQTALFSARNTGMLWKTCAYVPVYSSWDHWPNPKYTRATPQQSMPIVAIFTR